MGEKERRRERNAAAETRSRNKRVARESRVGARAQPPSRKRESERDRAENVAETEEERRRRRVAPGFQLAACLQGIGRRGFGSTFSAFIPPFSPPLFLLFFFFFFPHLRICVFLHFFSSTVSPRQEKQIFVLQLRGVWSYGHTIDLNYYTQLPFLWLLRFSIVRLELERRNNDNRARDNVSEILKIGLAVFSL